MVDKMHERFRERTEPFTGDAVTSERPGVREIVLRQHSTPEKAIITL